MHLLAKIARLVPLVAALTLNASPQANHDRADASPAANSSIQSRPTPAEVLALLEHVADWQLARPAKRPLHWVSGTFYTGVMALTGISPAPRFEAAMRKLGADHQWQLGPKLYHADDHCVGQTYVELYLRHRDGAMIAPMRESFDRILAAPKDDNLDFDRTKNPDRLDRWSWCDALFMSPPAWIRLWQATGDTRYLDFAVSKWWVTSNYLFDQEEGLYFRDSSFFNKREDNGRKIFWSRGNGWVLSGLSRILTVLPADHPDRPRFEAQFRTMAARVLECRQPDGLWRASLLAPEHYPMQETSGSAFFCQALAWGVNAGLLPHEPYATAALDSWMSLATFVQPDGKLTHVQPIGHSPVTFPSDSTAPYGVGALLLAGAEIHRLLQPGVATGP
jgi:rhamnogalacturonyl hydrolase YesR